MPRLQSSLLRRARHLHPLLPRLLRPCRDLASARNELRWLREHAIRADPFQAKPNQTRLRWQQYLSQLCRERARGKPLQYILGSQPFGSLEILCRPKVLIPRPETESIATHVASLLPGLVASKHESIPPQLRILDLCTGTGCIPYLLHSLLSHRIRDLRLSGVDISNAATNLARDNLEHNIRLGHLRPTARDQIEIVQDDIFRESDKAWQKSQWDVVISNPPYLSPNAFNNTTSRSVRNYEPKIALVPPQTPTSTQEDPVDGEAAGDMFYPRLLQIAHDVGAQVLLMEVAEMEQATRVAKMVLRSGVWSGCEIWRDWPASGGFGEREVLNKLGYEIEVRGEGHGRAVLAWRMDGGQIIGKV